MQPAPRIDSDVAIKLRYNIRGRIVLHVHYDLKQKQKVGWPKLMDNCYILITHLINSKMLLHVLIY